MILGARSILFYSLCACSVLDRIHAFLNFNSYGGPSSQKVDVEYKRDWHDYLVCTLQYVVVVVDGRGTGYKGRRLRNPVRYNMGFWETRDQINAARCVFCASFSPFFSARSRHPQHLGRQGLRRPESHWHMGLGKSFCTVNHCKLSWPSTSVLWRVHGFQSRGS